MNVLVLNCGSSSVKFRLIATDLDLIAKNADRRLRERNNRTHRRRIIASPPMAVFDTAFHQTLPDHAFLYALPYQLYRRYRLRRYGFHGISHRYVAYRYRVMRNIAREATNIITFHLKHSQS